MVKPTAAPQNPPASGHALRRPDRACLLAGAWAAGYGVLALVWTLTGVGYPYEHPDDLTLMRLLPPRAGGPVFAGVLLTTAVLAFAMAGRHAVRLRGIARAVLLGYGWLVAAALLLVVPDVEPLVVAGYAPMLILGAPFGWPPVDYATIFDWALLNKVIALVGGLLLARALLVWRRRTRGSCVWCGRGPNHDGWASATAARWGWWAAVVAAVAPALYATERLAWVLGFPVGIDRAFLAEMQASGVVWAGGGLAAFALVGSILTLGLVRPWGERFPRWMIGLAGRPVPIRLAVVPATLVAIAVMAASLAFLGNPDFANRMAGAEGAALPMLIWPLWSVALGAAAYAYYLRRRGTCPHCAQPASLA